MKKATIWMLLTFFIAASMVLASCGSSITATTQTTTTTTTQLQVTTTTNSTKATTTLTTTSSPAATGKWWDKFGVPQYGGEMNLRLNQNVTNWDPYNGANFSAVIGNYMEQPTATDWLTDPKVFDYTIGWLPPDFAKGFLATTWEFTDPTTYVLHMRQGVHYQNISPANGREMTADDVVYSYHRLYGGGDGFTKISPFWSTVAQWADLISVSATDKYTVIFKWKTPNVTAITGALQAGSCGNCIESPEAVKQWGDLSDWHHAIGTGAYMVKDFVSDSSVTFIKNPSYWGYDERYPQNQLPYVDQVNVLIIANNTTALAALRTGKLDDLDLVSWDSALALKKTNPELSQLGVLLGTELSVDPRNDLKPFNDIKVRTALQKAIDIPTIAATYYGGTASTLPGSLTSYSMTGFTYQYSDWPQALKDEYKYDPAAAKKLLADAGYPSGFKTNLVISNDSDLSLFQIVKAYFADIGVDMTITPMDPPAWQAYVLTSHKNDALAARNQGSLGLNFEPIVQIYRYSTGYRTNYMMVSDSNYDAILARGLAATSVDAFKQAMVDANTYGVQQHFVISVVQPKVFILYQPWLKGFEGQTNSIFGPMLFFYQYAPRFWIDQNVKKQYGH